MNKNRTKFFTWEILIFLIGLCPRILVNLPMMTTNGGHDDLGMLIIPSILAKYDWSGLIPNTAYYGFGYSIIYTPFLVLFRHNSYLFFQFIWGINAVFQSFTGIIVYRLLTKHYKMTNNLHSFFLSIIMSYMTYTAACRLENDCIMPLLTWIILYIITILYEEKANPKRQFYYSLLLILVLSYTLSIHSRSFIYWIGAGAIIIFVRLTQKRWIVNVPVFFLCGIGFYAAITVLIRYIQNNLWGTTNVTNSTSVIGDMITEGALSLLSFSSIKALISLISSNLYAITQYTNTFFLIGFVGFIMLFIKKIRFDITDISVQYIGMFFSFICFMIMYCGFCIAKTPLQHSMMLLGEATAHSFYIRYYLNFGVPLILFGYMIFLDISKPFARTILKYAFIFFLLCYAGTVLLLGNYHIRDAWNAFGVKYCGDADTQMTMFHYVIVFESCVAIVCILAFLSKHSHSVMLLAATILCIYQYAYQNLNASLDWSNNYYSKGDAFESAVLHPSSDVLAGCKIYVENKSAAYALQLQNPEYTIFGGIPESTDEKSIILCNYAKDELKDMGFYLLTLSDDENLYISDAELYAILSQKEQNE